MIPDYLDVTAGQDRRQALLARLMGQQSANVAGSRQFDRLNAESSRSVGLPRPPGQSPLLAGAPGPAPSAAMNNNRPMPGTPVTGTFSLLSLPPQLQQLVLRQFAPQAAAGQTDDTTRSALAARQPVPGMGV